MSSGLLGMLSEEVFLYVEKNLMEDSGQSWLWLPLTFTVNVLSDHFGFPTYYLKFSAHMEYEEYKINWI